MITPDQNDMTWSQKPLLYILILHMLFSDYTVKYQYKVYALPLQLTYELQKGSFWCFPEHPVQYLAHTY